MPSVKRGESRSSYLKRAIPEIKAEHPGKPMKAVIGQAEGMFTNHWTGSKREKGLKKMRDK